MKQQLSVLSDTKYQNAIKIFGILSLLYVLINLFSIGGDEFIYALNNNISTPLAIISTVFAFILWRMIDISHTNRILWRGLVAGWILWAIAEFLWLIFGYIYQEVPYPSPADFFWLVGYLPIGYGLYIRHRELPLQPNPTRSAILWGGITIAVVLTIIFILIPTLQTNNAENWFESLLNIIYPLTSLGILVIVLEISFTYPKGDYGLGWLLLAVGFILHSLSNLIFSYAVIQDLYYPNLQYNLLSGIGVDVPYNFAYLLWGFGLYAIWYTLTHYRPTSTEAVPAFDLIPNAHLLIFLRSDNTLISASDNFEDVMGMPAKKGSTLANALNATTGEVETLLEILKVQKILKNYSLQIKTSQDRTLNASVHGLATFLPLNGEYSGSNLVIQMVDPLAPNKDHKLSSEQKYMVSYLLKQNGTETELRPRIQKLLIEYHLLYVQRLYNLAVRTGGVQIGLTFMEEVKQILQAKHWPLEISQDALQITGQPDLALLQEVLPLLVASAKQVVSTLIEPAIIESEIQNISEQIGEVTHANIALCLQAGRK